MGFNKFFFEKFKIKKIYCTILIKRNLSSYPDCIREKNISVDFFLKYLVKVKDIKFIGEESPYPFTSKGGTVLKEDLEKMIFGNS